MLNVLAFPEPSLLLTFTITAFISILAIINPVSTVGVFLSLTKGYRQQEKDEVAYKTSKVGFAILVFFAITGFLVFQIYSITLEAFRIAGGIILLVIGAKMLFHNEQRTVKKKHVPDQIYLVPLAIPMGSGPGAITTAVVLASQGVGLWYMVGLWVAIFLAFVVNFNVLKYSELIEKKMGREGMLAVTKVMGLLVSAVGVQFIITGIKEAFPILA